MESLATTNPMDGVAIIGFAGRFPGASSAGEFWENLKAGKESISTFTDADLLSSGIDLSAIGQNYVRARAIITNVELFDADFFDISHREAEIIDPQQRIFLEIAHDTLEMAGYGSNKYRGLVAVYAGVGNNSYWPHYLQKRPELTDLVGELPAMIGNEKDYVATRTAYKLDLRGPAITVCTACSTSLVAICQAAQSLLNYQSDLALAGGVSLAFPLKSGYHYQPGAITSPDGHCRPFDRESGGTVPGSGGGAVLLKRLADAVADGDQVFAVIKGFALNNDGSAKGSFTSPSANGQAEVIATAQAIAGFDPETISYIESHGTATPLGDPIEMAGLTQGFGSRITKRNYCAIGAVKSNIGHLDVAAGVAGFIKTVMCLHNKQLVPTLHFTSPNPQIDFENSPFFVNTTHKNWANCFLPRRAGVSSFGLGGTNAHVALEEAPPVEPGSSSESLKVLLLSAKTPAALEVMTTNLGEYLEKHPELDLADVEYTLQVGRREFAYRRAIVSRDSHEAVTLLKKADPKKIFTGYTELKEVAVVFMFPGQGAQYAKMGATLYEEEKIFREAVDCCAAILQPVIGSDLRKVLFPAHGKEAEAEGLLRETRFTQPALFTIEYSLAQLLISWGIKPAAMIGHSVGEYAAACLAGVFSLDDALQLVARRAALVQAQPAGSMLAVRLSERDLTPLLSSRLSIAAVNSANLCVVSGPSEAIAVLEQQLAAKSIAGKRLHTSHAFHSAMMEPVVAPFEELVRKVPLFEPKIPFVSNVTGNWITAAEATSPTYWAGHVRQAVRFANGMAVLQADPHQILLEVGPGQTLVQLARQHPSRKDAQSVIAMLGGAPDHEPAAVTAATAKLWLMGVSIDWNAFHAGDRRRRVVLPTYPFQRKRCWPDSPIITPTVATTSTSQSTSAINVGASNTVINGTVSTANFLARIESVIVSRKEHLGGLIRTLVQELSGMDLTDAPAEVSFLEMGLDSLSLTQAATLFQRRFRVPVSFRRLMEDLASIDALALYLDEILPLGAFAPPAPAPPASPIAGAAISSSTLPTGVATETLDQLLQRQIELSSQILALLHGQKSNPAAKFSPQPLATIPVSETAKPTQTSYKAHGPFRPTDRGSTEGLTDPQQKWLEAFIFRYTKRTGGSKRLAAENRSKLADPRSAAGFKQLWKEMVYPLYSAKSDGSHLWDVDGNEYVDFVMGFGASLFGHRPPFVVEAAKRQLDLGFEIGPIQPNVGETAALFCEMTGNERAAFCNTGSEAMLAALRLARTVTGRDKIAMFAGSYHGIFDEVLARPLTVNGEVRAAPIAPGIPATATSQIMVLEWDNPESLELIRRCGHELAAVLVEPVQSRRLDLQPRDFLHELRHITEQTGAALVFDEIVTGFRVAQGGAQAFYGIRADIATYGKVVGGGFPIGIVAGRKSFLDALDGGGWQFGDASFPEAGVTFFAGTFVRHPVTIAVAKAVLEHLKREGPALQERTANRAAQAAGAMRALILRFGAPLNLAQFSSLMYVTPQPEFKYGGLLFYMLRERGIHIFENRAFVFTTAHSEGDVERLVRSFGEALEELKSNGFFRNSTPEASSVRVLPSAAASGRLEPTVVPLTEAQRELWLVALMSDAAALSQNVTITVRMSGLLNRATLIECLQTWIDRHDGLRVAFDREEPVQRIQGQLTLELGFTDLSSLPAPGRQGEWERLVRAQGSENFDLKRAPLFRLQLIQLGVEDYSLVLTISHLIADGWSVGVLLDELKLLYSAKILGTSADLEPALQLAPYQQILTTEAYKAAAGKAEGYWRNQFSSVPPDLELPGDRVRSAHRTYRAARVSIRWELEFGRVLKKASSRQGTTLFNFLLASFNVLLYRLSGQEEIVVGVPAAGQVAGALQDVEGARALVGHCVNLLPVRSQCRGDLSFADYLKGLKRTMLDAYDHQEMTFGRLLQLLNIPRDPARAPLVQTTFNVDRAQSVIVMGGLQGRIEEQPKAASVFDLMVNVVDNEENITLHCDFSTDLFDEGTITQWVSHYRTLLEGILENPVQSLDRLPLLSGADTLRLLKDWNNTVVDYPRDICLHHLIEAQVRLTPHTPAVIFEGLQLTYRELDAKANQLAHFLQERGIGADNLVGICMERSLEMVIGLVAILKAGGAYVPIDPSYPQNRLAHMLDDSGVGILLTQDHLLAKLPPHQAQAFCLDTDWQTIARGNTEKPAERAHAQGLAYMIYTSGSTGRPKGALNTHQAIVNRLLWMQDEYHLTGGDSVMQKTPFSFDVSVWEFFWPLLAGARLVMAAPGGHQDPAYLVNLIRSQNITVIHFVPSMLRAFLDAPEIDRCTSLREVICSGEALPYELQESFHSRLPANLENLYGPTEAAVDVTYWRCRRKSEEKSVPIGRPVANTQTYILDHLSHPVPVGVTGELHLGGIQVGRGYHKRPELTAEKFIANPFSSESGARLYKTGDLARYRSDGMIEYLGRIDHQVKIRGFRIELGEIESVLCQHPAVRKSVVVAREDEPGEVRLVGYLVTTIPAPESSEIRAHLKKHLPDHMVPPNIVFLGDIPLSSNGKIDRKALPKPEQSGLDSPKKYVAPRTETERKLAEIWSDLLHQPRVSIDADFFELGGHSLLALRMVSRIRQEFAVDLPLLAIFDSPTIAQIATKLSELQVSKVGAEELAMLLDEIESGSPGDLPSVRELG